MIERTCLASLYGCFIMSSASAGAVQALAGLVIGVVAGRLSRPKVCLNVRHHFRRSIFSLQ